MIGLPNPPQYLLESAICLAVFYLVYRLLLKGNTFFQANRGYLLCTAALSFLIPLLRFEYLNAEALATVVIPTEYLVHEFNAGMAAPSPAWMTWGQALLAVYLVGVMVLGIRLAARLRRVYLLGKGIAPRNGIRILPNGKGSSSSFFNWIFCQPEHIGNHWVIEHERVHARQWHSADVLFMEILCILNWFNPIIYSYKKSLREIHEFIADRHVARISASPYDYARTLLAEARVPALGIHNTFASLIKKRLIMLSLEKSKKRVAFRYLMAAPALCLLLALFSFNATEGFPSPFGEKAPVVTETDSLPPAPPKAPAAPEAPPVPKEMKATAPKAPQAPLAPKAPSVKEFDIPPVYGDCGDKTGEDLQRCSQMNIITRLFKSVRYPEAARKEGTQGIAIVEFVVGADGKMKDFKLLRDPGDGLGEEALRAIKSMPEDWTPGVLDGKEVAVKQVLPVKFKLDKKGKKGKGKKKKGK